MPSTPQPEELSLEIPGLRLAARAWGTAEGQPVLALHGWLDNAASFDALAPLLPAQLRLVCLDLPGHGLSEHRGRDAYQHLFDYVPQIFAAADSLEWERFALLGHSMGGGIGVLAAGALPERATSLVAIEGLGPLSSPPEEAPERMGRYIVEHRAWTAGGEARPYPSREQAIAARMNQPNAPLTPRAAEILAARGLREGPDGFHWRHDPRARITSMLRLTEEHVLAFLRRITCPVLAIGATGGWPYARERGRERLARLANVRALRKPGDHHLHLNTPEVVAEEIAAFLLESAES